jgi:phosphatidylethanolamine-binding protein (PEBP) family uncharacterized protein
MIMKLIISACIAIMICSCGGGGNDGGVVTLPGDTTQDGVVSGVWEGTTTLNNSGESTTSFDLTQQGQSISGSITFNASSTHVTGSVNNGTVTIEASFQTRQGENLEFTYTGTVNNGGFSGTVDIVSAGGEHVDQGTFSLVRAGDNPGSELSMAGEWEGSFTLKIGTVCHTHFNLNQHGSDISGTWELDNQTGDGTMSSDDVSGMINGNAVSISVMYRSVEITGDYMEFDYEGTLDGSNFNGLVTMFGYWKGENKYEQCSCPLTRNGDNLTQDQISMQVEFTWTTADECSEVSPEIRVTGIPGTTKTLKVSLTDLDSPDSPHGGGSVRYDGSNIIPAGALNEYYGPCPPFDDQHNYSINVDAIDDSGAVVGSGEKTLPCCP